VPSSWNCDNANVIPVGVPGTFEDPVLCLPPQMTTAVSSATAEYPVGHAAVIVAPDVVETACAPAPMKPTAMTASDQEFLMIR
jgi:hypothetical protein